MSSDHLNTPAWAVWQSYTEDEAAQAQSRALDQRTWRRTPLNRGQLARDLLVVSARAHEWAHYRQHISTHHGIFLDGLWQLRSWASGHFRKHAPNFRGSMRQAYATYLGASGTLPGDSEIEVWLDRWW